MNEIARFMNACIPPAILLYAMAVTKPGRPDHTWSGITAIFIVWLLYRVYKAFDYDREYNFWSLKILLVVVAFGLVDRLFLVMA